MKLNLNIPLVEINGAPVKSKAGEDIFLFDVVRDFLLFPHEDLEQMSEEAKQHEQIRRYGLAKRVQASPDAVDVSLDEAKLLQKLASQMYTNPTVPGRLDDEIQRATS